MAANYNPKIVTDGLVLCLDAGNAKSYPGTGTTWNDISRNGNTGTLTNGPTYGSDNGGSLIFDGSNDFVEVSPTKLNESIVNSISIECWVYPKTTSYQLIGGGQDNTGSRYTAAFNINSDGANIYGFDLEATSGQVRLTSSSNTLEVNKWKHLTGTYDGSTASFYINGTLIDSDNGTSGNIINFDNFILGKDIATSRHLNGNIACFKVYNRALSASEIEQNFNALRGRFGI
jgi:hypothetical protein